MDINLDDVAVRDNEDAHRYEARVGDQLATIVYHRSGDQITFTHTETPMSLEGHGIAGKMARTALEDARAQHLGVVPRCPYVASYIRRHQEYMDLVVPSARAMVERSS